MMTLIRLLLKTFYKRYSTIFILICDHIMKKVDKDVTKDKFNNFNTIHIKTAFTLLISGNPSSK